MSIITGARSTHLTDGQESHDPGGQVVAALDPIDLDSLIGAAELQTRMDRKYLLPARTAWKLIAHATPEARVLEIDGVRGTDYVSTYLDTPQLASLRTAAYGRRRRFKARIRSYAGGDSFVEVKTRDGRGRSVKQRWPRAASAPSTLTTAEAAAVRAALGRAHVRPADIDALHPTLTTAYTRTTLLMPTDPSRVTVDRDLAWSDPDGREIALNGLVVVETKSARSAGVVDRALWRAGHRPRRISKYATGMTLMDPGLPGNRWHRTRGVLGPHVHTASPPARTERT